MATRVAHREHPPLGRLLQHWRRIRRKSQLELSVAAEVSARHLAFVETGRTHPSREMVLQLAEALDVPLRERNALLVAAGFAPMYRETDLSAPELAPARQALDHILAQQEPYPAVVMDRHWNLAASNRAAAAFFGMLVGDDGPPAPANVVRLMFHPRGLRPHVANWDVVAESLIQRVHREAVCGVTDAETEALLAEALAYPGVPERWRAPDPAAPLAPLVPVEFRVDGRLVRYFSTVTTLGTPQDITLQELRIECFHPADADTAAFARAMPRSNGTPGTRDR
jgi:transcriptional regulator with XRE-family HTH domain